MHDHRSDPSRPHDPRLGTLEPAGEGRWRLCFERTVRHPPARVWRALLDDADLSAWFPCRIIGERRLGARLTFRFEEADGLALDGLISAFEPERLLEFSWGEDLLRFELHAVPDGTHLVMTDTFGELGRAARDGAGWHVCLDALAARVEGGPSVPDGAWAAVHPRYVEVFGPEAATIGPPAGHPAAG